MKFERFLKILDLIYCSAFAVPGLSTQIIGLLSALSVVLGWGIIVQPNGLGAAFVNLFGVLGVLWNLAMLQLQDERLDKLDVPFRFVIAAILAYHITIMGLSPLFWFFVVSEMLGAFVQLRNRFATS